MREFLVNNLEETLKFAQEMIAFVRSDFYFLLEGDLGSGKTTFTKQLLKLLGVKENVTSPTFVIMNQYEGNQKLKINHVDAYRLIGDSENEMYFDEFKNAFNIIEWYENLNLDFNEINYLKISFIKTGDNSRKITVKEK
ncbi:tRNA (N6-adenosine(37)-N6)-threonylcarbamoyltransferase complex ATPase TsaE [Williamsoniiplasma somnilux]|uniref:tRNA threonylcarbamoyladenosine biosynthesis protein TsaE n=1 Tax=Williamsoniiplasma somnilux TaxID=215578 RepID=A0A2K8NYQ6_9MOLU|nr:tRNA (adenosine(37)-N6)-threonylcarbamoyltransferase complex ATPase subunit type 1 TsaE [Williamsoniiplasma somnilux]ATZ18952.1 tRNA (N6-adenosine(37)-N6)-threonylcarbamoyltransferase complex ATPase TsaE [Williamsoniiplasma somnilux]